MLSGRTRLLKPVLGARYCRSALERAGGLAVPANCCRSRLRLPMTAVAVPCRRSTRFTALWRRNLKVPSEWPKRRLAGPAPRLQATRSLPSGETTYRANTGTETP